MNFGNPLLLWLLLIPLVLWFLEKRMHAQVQSRLSTFGSLSLVEGLMNVHAPARILKRRLFYAAIILVLVALARPQWGQKEETVTSKGLEVIFAIDVSKSMFSEDVVPNRLEKSLLEIDRLIDVLSLNRLGLITFAGSASPVVPITSDQAALKMFLKSVKYHHEEVPGTNLQTAFTQAEKMFTHDSGHDKVLILFTDGESNDGHIDGIADKARDEKIHIYPIGVGTQSGQPIPVLQNGVPSGYLKDKKGNVVISHLDLDVLKNMATENKLFLINEKGGSTAGLYQELAGLQKGTFSTKHVSSKVDRYPIFILLALLCLLAEFSLTQATQLRWKGKKILTLALCVGLCVGATGRSPLHASTPLGDLRILKGNSFYKDGNYKNAYKFYQMLPDDEPKAHLNRGLALEKSKQYPAAEAEFGKAIQQLNPAKGPQKVSQVKHKQLVSEALYDLGNSLVGDQKYTDALNAYQQSLLINPRDIDTKHNLELTRRLIKKQEQEQKQQKQKQQKAKAKKSDDPKDNEKKQNAKSVLDSFKDQEQQDLEEQMQKQAREKKVEKDW